MSQILYQLNDNDLTFPPVAHALTDPNGLLAIDGDLKPQRLIQAYSQGIFPWYSEGDPLMWWSPDPRAIIELNELRINKTLRKIIKKSPYQVTLNLAFNDVTAMCANAPFRDDDTWILPEMLSAYSQLHQLGYAHSIEVWQTHDDNNDNNDDKEDGTTANKTLVGGLYGVAINGFFSGESMFYTKSNASKFALVGLSQLLKTANIDFIDCQLLNPFLEDMGAKEISREDFLLKQQAAIVKILPDNFWQTKVLYI